MNGLKALALAVAFCCQAACAADRATTGSAAASDQANNLDETIATLTKSLEADPTDGRAYRLRGEAFAEKRDWSRAVEDLNQAIRIDPENAQNFRTRARILARMSQEDEAVAEKLATVLPTVRSVEQWIADDVRWLDMLSEICERIPTAGDLRLTELTASSSRAGHGSVKLAGMAREPAAIDAMQAALRGLGHQVQPVRVHQGEPEPPYEWQFEGLVALRADLLGPATAAPSGSTADRLAVWQARSLPADLEIAQSTYRVWLLDIARSAALRDGKLDVGAIQSRTGMYRIISFSLSGRCSAGQLAELLWHFRASGHLHKLRSISIRNRDGGREMEVVLSIQAMSLPTADGSVRPSERPPGEPARRTMDEYRDVVSRRNPFARPAAQAPDAEGSARPNVEPGEPMTEFDSLRHAVVVAITIVNDRTQVWILNRATSETWRLFPNDAFKIGEVSGKVIRIAEDHAEFEVGGRRRVVGLGENLAGNKGS